MTAPSQADELVELAAVVRAHGLNGELLLKQFNPESDLLTRSTSVVLRLPSGALQTCEVTGVRGGVDSTLLALRGVSRREEAEPLRGSVVCVPRATLPPLEEGEYYLVDLVGLKVRSPQGEIAGHVESVIEYPSVSCLVVVVGDVWREVPDLPRYVPEVHVREGYVVVDNLDEIDPVAPAPRGSR